MKKLFPIIVVLAVFGVVSAAFAVGSIDMPLDAQINIGRSTIQSPSGDAMYDPFGGDTIGFPGDEAEGYVRHYIDAGGAGSWAYMYVDFFLAGETADYIDMSPGGTIEFDTRFFNDPLTNTNPYGDAPVFLRLYTYDLDPVTGEYDVYLGNRDYGIVYGPTGEEWHPTWTHVTVDIESGTDSGAFDPAKVSRLRFYNTNWSGGGDDFVDYKNLSVTVIPEPSTIAMFGFGLLSLLAMRRKK